MKKLLLVAFAAASLASCSDDDNNSNPAENEMALKKVETFTPSQAIYTSGITNGYSERNVKYYQNNTIVADSTFSIDGSLYRYVERTQTGNTLVISNFETGFGEFERHTYTLDAQNRIIHDVWKSYTGSQIEAEYDYTYTANAIVIYAYPHEGNNQTGSEYSWPLNDFGIVQAVGPQIFTMENDKPISQTGLDTITFNYYTTAVPSGFVKSVAQLNNMVIMSGHLRDLVTNGNYYVSDIGNIHYAKEFNTLNYITHDKASDGELDPQDVYSYEQGAYERFYYYN